MYGFNGRILHVTLPDRIREDRVPDDVAKRLLGGRGLSAYILYDGLKADVNPFGPENKIIFATGPFAYYGVPGGTRYIAAAKSPLTGILGFSSAAGDFGPEIRSAGYDAIVVDGASNEPVYLWVHDGEAEIKEAGKFWGSNTGETTEGIRKDHGDKKIKVASIGIGGENLVKYACIISDFHRAAGREGMGAVMGSKKLKAVAVRGTKKVDIASPEKLKKYSGEIVKILGGSTATKDFRKFGTASSVLPLDEDGILPTMNFSRGTFENAEEISGETMTKAILVSNLACTGCPVGCIRSVKTEEVDPKYGGPEYETIGAFGSLLLNKDLRAIAKANELCNKHSIDTISTGVCIAFAMECYEKGLLGKKDVQGLNLSWGNSKVIIQLVEKIARREGLGNLLAEGVRAAAEKIGKGSEDFAMHVKGSELPMHEARGKKGLGLSYATSNRGACHLQSAHDPDFEKPSNKLAKEFGVVEPISRFETKAKPRIIIRSQDYQALMDSLVICKFVGFWNDVTSEHVGSVLSAITGWDVSVEDLFQIGERVYNLERIFNVREGIRREHDLLPKRLSAPLPEGASVGMRIAKEELEEMKDEYYRIRGWDIQTGVPSEKKLTELTLQFAIASTTEALK